MAFTLERTLPLLLAWTCTPVSATSPPASVATACGLQADRPALRGNALTLGVTQLCTSYDCRASLLMQAQSSVVDVAALFEDLLHCVMPKSVGAYVLLDFIVLGLHPANNLSWPVWYAQAFEKLGAKSGDVRHSVWFPQPGSAGVRFYTTVTSNFNVSAALSAISIGAALRTGVMFNTTFSVSDAIQIKDFKSSVLDVTVSESDVALSEMFWIKVISLSVLVYALIALIVHHFGPPCLTPYVLCWPQLCDGGGCIIYRVLCSPLVLVYNAFWSLCWVCCCSYLARLADCKIFKGMCWHDYTDADFPPDARSIGKVKGDTASGVKSSDAVEWARASEIASKSGRDGAHLFQGEIEPGDVLQGALGDCWLMAAIASVAERPEILEQVIASKHVDFRGKYHFKLFNQIKDNPGTKWVDIVVDEMIPVEPGTLHPKFARTHCNEMWVMLLEKAFAKMYGGYDRLDGGQMHWALTAMTGNPYVSFFKEKPGTEWTCDNHCISDDNFFNFLYHVRRNGAFVCCAMIAPANKMGLIDGHAYSVIQVQTVYESMWSTSLFRFVQIRNPHGQTEWTGAWSDKSASWDQYPHIREQLCGSPNDRVEDGTFWMQWEDFVHFWKTVEVVDCGTSIRMFATPVDRNPTLACLVGCWRYWCCCESCKLLYCSREPAKDFAGLATGDDRRWGCDESGFFCDIGGRKWTSYHTDAKSGKSDKDIEERFPLCMSCDPRCGARAKLSRNSREVSRKAH